MMYAISNGGSYSDHRIVFVEISDQLSEDDVARLMRYRFGSQGSILLKAERVEWRTGASASIATLIEPLVRPRFTSGACPIDIRTRKEGKLVGCETNVAGWNGCGFPLDLLPKVIAEMDMRIAWKSSVLWGFTVKIPGEWPIMARQAAVDLMAAQSIAQGAR